MALNVLLIQDVLLAVVIKAFAETELLTEEIVILMVIAFLHLLASLHIVIPTQGILLIQ